MIVHLVGWLVLSLERESGGQILVETLFVISGGSDDG